jgi:hypothetical protein
MTCITMLLNTCNYLACTKCWIDMLFMLGPSRYWLKAFACLSTKSECGHCLIICAIVKLIMLRNWLSLEIWFSAYLTICLPDYAQWPLVDDYAHCPFVVVSKLACLWWFFIFLLIWAIMWIPMMIFFMFLLIWALYPCHWCYIILCMIKYDRLLDRSSFASSAVPWIPPPLVWCCQHTCACCPWKALSSSSSRW